MSRSRIQRYLALDEDTEPAEEADQPNATPGSNPEIQLRATVEDVREISSYWKIGLWLSLTLPIGGGLFFLSLFLYYAWQVPFVDVMSILILTTMAVVRLLIVYCIKKDISALKSSPIDPGWKPRHRWYTVPTLIPVPPIGVSVVVMYLIRRHWYYRVPQTPSITERFL